MPDTHQIVRLLLFLLCHITWAHAQASLRPAVTIDVDKTTGAYTVNLDGVPWYQSPRTHRVCVAGTQAPLTLQGTLPAAGSDKFGAWAGVMASFVSSGTPQAVVAYTFKHYPAQPSLAVASAEFPKGLDTRGCGRNDQLSTQFPAFDTSAAQAALLHTLSWRGTALSLTKSAKGLHALGANGLDCGPVVSTEPNTGTTLVWSTLDAHKIVPQQVPGGGRVRGWKDTV